MKQETAVREKLRAVLDPELGVSIIDLGLIYEVLVAHDGTCAITMTLTTIGCPLFAQIQKDIEHKVLEVEGITRVSIELTFDPPWTPDKMSEAARIELGLE